MRFLKTISAAATLAVAGLLAPALATGAAAAWDADRYRVVEVPGAQTLALRAGPASWANIVVELPFDARDLRATGVSQGNWVQLTYRTTYGGELTGWARVTQVALEDSDDPTVFRVVGLARRARLEVRSQPGAGRLLGTVSSRYDALRSAGECDYRYCPVRYTNRRGTFIGWVEQQYVAVVRPVSQYAEDASYGTVTIEAETGHAEVAPEATPTAWQPKRRGFLWRLFNPELVLEGY